MSKEAERVTEATGAEASKAALIATVPVQLMRRDSNKDTLSKLTRVLVVLGIIAVVRGGSGRTLPGVATA